MNEEIVFPLYFKTDKTGFDVLLGLANDKLGYPNQLALIYCEPIVIENDYYFLVNPEVSDLVDLNLCIQLP
jgi:hypothetical protein